MHNTEEDKQSDQNISKENLFFIPAESIDSGPADDLDQNNNNIKWQESISDIAEPITFGLLNQDNKKKRKKSPQKLIQESDGEQLNQIGTSHRKQFKNETCDHQQAAEVRNQIQHIEIRNKLIDYESSQESSSGNSEEQDKIEKDDDQSSIAVSKLEKKKTDLQLNLEKCLSKKVVGWNAELKKQETRMSMNLFNKKKTQKLVSMKNHQSNIQKFGNKNDLKCSQQSKNHQLSGFDLHTISDKQILNSDMWGEQTDGEGEGQKGLDVGKMKKSSILGESIKQFKENIKIGKNRKKSVIEKKFKFGELAAEINSDQNLRKIFIEKYGVEMEYPGYYLMDARFVPQDQKFQVNLSWLINPEPQNTGTTTQTTFIDGTYNENSDTEQSNGKNQLSLKLLQPNKRHTFDTIREIFFKGDSIGIQEPGKKKKVGRLTAMIEFSRSGSFFAIYVENTKELNVYESTDIHKCFDYINNNQKVLEFSLEKRNFGKLQRIVFDKNDQYVAVRSQRCVIILPLKNKSREDKDFKHEFYQIEEQYQYIVDMTFDSAVIKPGSINYTCLIATKQSGRNVIDIFDINNPKQLRSIAYNTDGFEDRLLVKISDDFKKVIFSNGVEHYILHGDSQDSFPQIKDKFVRNVINHKDSFYFVSCKDYDRDIDILNSEDPSFNASIKRGIEPGLVKVYDSTIQTVTGDHGITNIMKVLIDVGDHLYLEQIDMAKCYGNPKEAHIQSNIDKFYTAYGFNWPYFSYASKFNFLYIMNCFNPSFIQRYELPRNIHVARMTFLTDTHDFFTILETIDDHYEVYTVNLDSPDPYLEGPLFKYSFSDCDNKQIDQFHVRGSSKKERVNLNKQLMIFMLHRDQLYTWNEKSTKITLVDEGVSDIKYFSDECLFYRNTKTISVGKRDNIQHSVINMIEMQFGTFKKTEVYQDKDLRAEILNFGVDSAFKKIIILTGIKNNKEKRDKFITLFDIETEKVQYSQIIKDPEIIGRLKSNLYIFVGGHIYYGNNVIKIRYDLIEQVEQLKNNQVFDYYGPEMLFLKKNYRVQSGSPLQSSLYHRLAFIVRNANDLKCRRIVILPYLHERKIVLNQRNTANQFYTLLTYNQINYILCICISDNKMYIYTETGILVDRIKFNDIAVECGKPIAISENGQVLIFRKGEESENISLINISINKLDKIKTINVKDEIEKYLEIQNGINGPFAKEKTNFWNIYLKKFHKMKNIDFNFTLNDNQDIMVRIRPTEEQRIKIQQKQIEEFIPEEDRVPKEWRNCQFYLIFPKNFKINQFKYIGDFAKKSDVENSKPFIIFDGVGNQVEKESIIQGTSMNDKYIFFWNLSCVFYIDLSNALKRQSEIRKLSFFISESGRGETFIKTVRTGSDKDIVGIRVQQTPRSDKFMLWDMTNDLEIDSFDIESNAIFFQDRQGNPFIAEKDYIINCRQKCKLKSYKLKANHFYQSQKQFGFVKGIRMDDVTHNFIIFRNYINLSFSYMTFVIKENFDKQGYIVDDYLFDPEGYDYIFTKHTIFTQGELALNNFDKLKFILKNYEEIDPILLEQLFYKNEENGTPLHLAVSKKNTRMVNLILEYMAKVDNAGITIFKDIFSELINYKSFVSYLNEAPFKTVQMMNKQTINLNWIISDSDIISTATSSCSYVDKYFFKNSMRDQSNDGQKNEPIQIENITLGNRFQKFSSQFNSHYVLSDTKTYAIKVQAVKADWIINQPCGMMFLKEMLKQQNKEVFMTPYIKIVVQYLYHQYQHKIWKYLLPPYIIHLLTVTIGIHLAESARESNISDNGTATENEIFGEISNLDQQNSATIDKFNLNKVCLLAQGVITLSNLFIFIKQSKHLGFITLQRKWSIIDFVIISLNIVSVSSLFINIELKLIRIIEAFLIIFIYLKSLYFLRLVGEIAPLVDIIFVILHDITYFLLIFIIGLAGFSHSFYVIGKNQIMLQDKENLNQYSENGEHQLQYSTYLKALIHVYLSSLGEFDSDTYLDNEMSIYLSILFLGLSFFMCIILLNMLIAMMGDSFQKNNEMAEAKKKISQLNFVVDNWWIDPIIDKQRIVYIVAAFAIQDQDNNQNKLDNLSSTMSGMKDSQQQMMMDLTNIHYNLTQNH